eukprot:365661-Chlamydomonas_euryale.AAC.22
MDMRPVCTDEVAASAHVCGCFRLLHLFTGSQRKPDATAPPKQKKASLQQGWQGHSLDQRSVSFVLEKAFVKQRLQQARLHGIKDVWHIVPQVNVHLQSKNGNWAQNESMTWQHTSRCPKN